MFKKKYCARTYPKCKLFKLNKIFKIKMTILTIKTTVHKAKQNLFHKIQKKANL